jgi:hypothetical protein
VATVYDCYPSVGEEYAGVPDTTCDRLHGDDETYHVAWVCSEFSAERPHTDDRCIPLGVVYKDDSLWKGTSFSRPDVAIACRHFWDAWDALMTHSYGFRRDFLAGRRL